MNRLQELYQEDNDLKLQDEVFFDLLNYRKSHRRICSKMKSKMKIRQAEKTYVNLSLKSLERITCLMQERVPQHLKERVSAVFHFGTGDNEGTDGEKYSLPLHFVGVILLGISLFQQAPGLNKVFSWEEAKELSDAWQPFITIGWAPNLIMMSEPSWPGPDYGKTLDLPDDGCHLTVGQMRAFIEGLPDDKIFVVHGIERKQVDDWDGGVKSICLKRGRILISSYREIDPVSKVTIGDMRKLIANRPDHEEVLVLSTSRKKNFPVKIFGMNYYENVGIELQILPIRA